VRSCAWVVNACVLTFAGFLLLGGRAADSFGRRRIFMLGLLLFVGTSIVGSFAQSAGWLSAARAVQGIGGAALSPATLTIIITAFSGKRLARALGVWERYGRCRPVDVVGLDDLRVAGGADQVPAALVADRQQGRATPVISTIDNHRVADDRATEQAVEDTRVYVLLSRVGASSPGSMPRLPDRPK
jgi:hypothetical protein